MTTLVSVCAESEVAEGEVKGIELPTGVRIALYRLDGEIFATDDTCTHENASLSDEGMVEGDMIVCGWHFCGFKIRTGEAVQSPCYESLRTLPVRVVDGVVHVEC